MAGLGEWQAGGCELLGCYFYTEAASIWLYGGDARHAEIELKRAFDLAERTGEGYYSAEMHRLRGVIKWLRTSDFVGAETDLVKAMEVATSQGSLTFRLRAATSLLRLTHTRADLVTAEKERRIAEHKDLLATIYQLFEGQRDSPDLRAARALLRETPNGPGSPDSG